MPVCLGMQNGSINGSSLGDHEATFVGAARMRYHTLRVRRTAGVLSGAVRVRVMARVTAGFCDGKRVRLHRIRDVCNVPFTITLTIHVP